MSAILKACRGCGIVFTVGAFPVHAYRADGTPRRNCRCRGCRNDVRRAARSERLRAERIQSASRAVPNMGEPVTYAPLVWSL